MALQHYLGKPTLKAAGVQIPFTSHQVTEFTKCAQDPIYFLENYAKIVSLDKGPVLFKLFPYQKRIIRAMHENKKIIGKLFRQAGKSTVIAGYFAWYVLFNSDKTIAILANKESIAKEIFSRVQYIIEGLPFWLQQGVEEWNKKSFKLENGSKCFCAASSASAVRGQSINMLLCDEFAHLHPNLAEEFIASVFPTLSSSENSKLILISTPKGMNHFYKIWVEAEKGTNGFVPVEGKWQEHPFRTQKWADEQLAELGDVKFRQEVLCDFIGSSYTLINGSKIASIPFNEPVFKQDCLKIYEKPIPEHSYVITVDVSRGQYLDFSAFTVFDITQTPYKVVATFKDNKISTLAYPFLILNTAKQYNNAYALVEINDIGQEVANTLWYEYEYENLYFTSKDKRLVEGGGYPGVRSTKSVKATGCVVLKDLIEKDQLLVESYDIIQEMGVFVQKRTSYAADDTSINDDLMTTLWLFAWLTKQPIFSDLTNVNIRALLSQANEKRISEEMTPFGFYDNGIEQTDNSTEVAFGQFIETVRPDDRWIFTNVAANLDDDMMY